MRMKTKYLKVDTNNIDAKLIAQAAEILSKGELLAFPTETVYGLGALANNPRAIEKIFIAKGRPQENPLLVHISQIHHLDDLAIDIPVAARMLMEKFWPGPLSIILKANLQVPAEVRASKPYIGLRMPNHPVALALIDKAGPIAAPSANLYGRPSPITAEHVRTDLDGKIAALIDAGPTGMGIESTLLDMSGNKFKVLRLGAIAVKDIEDLLEEEVELDLALRQESKHNSKVKLVLAESDEEFKNVLDEYLNKNAKIAVIVDYNDLDNTQKITKIYKIDWKNLDLAWFSIIREAEQEGIEAIIFSPIPDDISGIALSVRDRIVRNH